LEDDDDGMIQTKTYEIRCNYCGTLVGYRKISEDKIIDDVSEEMADLLRVEEDDKGFTSLVEVVCKACGIENEILW